MSEQNSNTRQVKCPQCGLLSLYSPANPSRPFCSERCKLIDLGAWASEGYKVPVQTQDYNEAELEQLYSAMEANSSGEHATQIETIEIVAGRKQQE